MLCCWWRVPWTPLLVCWSTGSDIGLWLSLCLRAGSPLCKSSMQSRLFICAEMCSAPAVTWSRLREWTARCKSSGVHFLSGCRALYSNWIWTPVFPHHHHYHHLLSQIILLCVCLWHVVGLEMHSTLPLFLRQLLDVPQCELRHE